MPPDPLLAFRSEPGSSAVLFDVDGTLAPIVDRPEQARVPPETLRALAALVARYRLVGLISGRSLRDLDWLVPVEGLLRAGNHGLELDLGEGRGLAPGAEDAAGRADALAAEVEAAVLAAGGWVERKGPTLTVHWREAADPEQAAAAIDAAARPAARAAGFEARPARMALELRPVLPLDKGTAVAALLAARPSSRSLFAGDDVTDVDGFRAADVGVAVRNAEAPPSVVEAADVVVDGVDELLARL
jgi:trehalose-phosphatase